VFTLLRLVQKTDTVALLHLLLITPERELRNLSACKAGVQVYLEPRAMASRINILHVEDDPNDALLFEHACRKAEVAFDLQSVSDGDEAMTYLRGLREECDGEARPLPQLILLDLKMPRVSGFDLLAWLRSEVAFQKVPVIVLTSSNHESDIKRAYDLGANSYLVKPVSFEALVEIARRIHGYWLTHNEGCAR
jgi:CheY-like chemotaxis protein